MYNLTISGTAGERSSIKDLFGDKYDLTDDLSQTNILVICGSDVESAEIPDIRLLFAICDMTDGGLPENALTYCADHGICVFRDADSVKDFIENGNVKGSIGSAGTTDYDAASGMACTDRSPDAEYFSGFPDIDLGPFGNDACRVVIMMKGIDDPILLAAMMFSGMDVRAIAGGLFSKASYTHDPVRMAQPAADSDQNKKSSGDAAGIDNIYGLALVALREPVTRIPHVDGVLKVRVLQDI